MKVLIQHKDVLAIARDLKRIGVTPVIPSTPEQAEWMVDFVDAVIAEEAHQYLLKKPTYAEAFDFYTDYIEPLPIVIGQDLSEDTERFQPFDDDFGDTDEVTARMR